MSFAGKRALTDPASNAIAPNAKADAVGKQTLTQMAGAGVGAPQGAGTAALTAHALPNELRTSMERSFGADLSKIRIFEHGPGDSIGAQAYTQGEEIHFAAGQYDPTSAEGKQVIGHEITHYMHQQHGMTGGAQAQARGAGGDLAMEQEAEHLGARAARGESGVWPHAKGTASPTTARQFYNKLGEEDWKRNPEHAPRSRYSGAPLEDNKMVITIAMQKSQELGHSFVVFEWFYGENNEKHHKLFHFNPALNSSNQEYTNPEKLAGVPGNIEQTDEREYLPRWKDDKMIPTNYRSWEVSWSQGNAGYQKACALAASPPDYMLRKYNCADFANDVASAGGVNAQSWTSTFAVTVPAWENYGSAPLNGTEHQMWEARKAKDAAKTKT